MRNCGLKMAASFGLARGSNELVRTVVCEGLARVFIEKGHAGYVIALHLLVLSDIEFYFKTRNYKVMEIDLT